MESIPHSSRGRSRRWSGAATTLAATLVAVVATSGCVTRQAPMPLDGPSGGAGAGGAGGSTTGAGAPSAAAAWQHAADPNVAFGPASSVWPVRVPMPRHPDGSIDLSIHLLLPEQRAPEQRVHIGSRGVGVVERVLVEDLTDRSALERLRREQGFEEWLVVQTLRREIKITARTAEHAVGLARAFSIEHDGLRNRDDGTDEPLSGRPDQSLGELEIRLFEAAETSFALYLPESIPRGIVVQMTNLAGNTDWERRLTQSFRQAGWAVLSTFVPDGWGVAASRTLDANDDPRKLGQTIAALVDDRLAEWAYAVEAILEDMRERHPEVARRPLIGIGNSIGAMALPAVSARLDAPFDAVVLVGGGADTLAIMRSTTLGNSVTPLSWRDGRRPSRTAWEEIAAAYRDATRLDALRTAPLLRAVPTLQLHAEWDSIVPARSGDLLWESLGRPERWTYRSGHLGLFVFWLPRERDRIVGWVDDAISRVRNSSDGS